MSVSTPNQDTRRDLSGRSTPVIEPGNAYDERTPLLGEPGEGRRPRAALWSSTVWAQSKGMVLVMLSQFFGASMNVMTQVLEVKGKNGEGLHPFQVFPPQTYRVCLYVLDTDYIPCTNYYCRSCSPGCPSLSW